MARIRTIKPEFPQSESMGRISRDARLLFALLWTVADDEGRARAASRLLASLLFPYDQDAPALIDGWLSELEREQCVVLYELDGTHYLQITNWLEHQKIDRPTKSRLPAFDENSRKLAKDREASTTDLGPRTVDHGPRTIAADAATREDSVKPDAEVDLFRRGKEILGKEAGGLIRRVLKNKNGSVPLARATIETAATKQDPREWIGAVLRNGTGPPGSDYVDPRL